MTRTKTLPGFDGSTDGREQQNAQAQTLTAQVIEWLTRDYDECEQWKNRGRALYLATSGDSVATRYLLADELRKGLLCEKRTTVDCAMWTTKSDSPIRTSVTPPKVDESNVAYADWVRIADYFLLSARVMWDALEQENQTRRQAYDRMSKDQALRQKVKNAKEYMRNNPKAKNKEIVAALKETDTPVAATQLTLARAELSQGIPDRDEKELEQPRELALYTPLYF